MSYHTTAIIVPVLNEAKLIRARLPYFQQLKNISELIFVDGGSRDGSAEQLRRHGHIVLDSSQASHRGAQLATGIRYTDKPIICMHHCDTMPTRCRVPGEQTRGSSSSRRALRSPNWHSSR